MPDLIIYPYGKPVRVKLADPNVMPSDADIDEIVANYKRQYPQGKAVSAGPVDTGRMPSPLEGQLGKHPTTGYAPVAPFGPGTTVQDVQGKPVPKQAVTNPNIVRDRPAPKGIGFTAADYPASKVPVSKKPNIPNQQVPITNPALQQFGQPNVAQQLQKSIDIKTPEGKANAKKAYKDQPSKLTVPTKGKATVQVQGNASGSFTIPGIGPVRWVQRGPGFVADVPGLGTVMAPDPQSLAKKIHQGFVDVSLKAKTPAASPNYAESEQQSQDFYTNQNQNLTAEERASAKARQARATAKDPMRMSLTNPASIIMGAGEHIPGMVATSAGPVLAMLGGATPEEMQFLARRQTVKQADANVAAQMVKYLIPGTMNAQWTADIAKGVVRSLDDLGKGKWETALTEIAGQAGLPAALHGLRYIKPLIRAWKKFRSGEGSLDAFIAATDKMGLDANRKAAVIDAIKSDPNLGFKGFTPEGKPIFSVKSDVGPVEQVAKVDHAAEIAAKKAELDARRAARKAETEGPLRQGQGIKVNGQQAEVVGVQGDTVTIRYQDGQVRKVKKSNLNAKPEPTPEVTTQPVPTKPKPVSEPSVTAPKAKGSGVTPGVVATKTSTPNSKPVGLNESVGGSVPPSSLGDQPRSSNLSQDTMTGGNLWKAHPKENDLPELKRELREIVALQKGGGDSQLSKIGGLSRMSIRIQNLRTQISEIEVAIRKSKNIAADNVKVRVAEGNPKGKPIQSAPSGIVFHLEYGGRKFIVSKSNLGDSVVFDVTDASRSVEVGGVKSLPEAKQLISSYKPKSLDVDITSSPTPKESVTTPKATKEPFTFTYQRNPEKAPKVEGYGQDIEPAGRYVTEAPDKSPPGWERGTITFNNPLRIEFGGGYKDPSNWKNVLSQKYGGKTGKGLSEAIREDGYDGIVTFDKYGTSEIVDLTSKRQPTPNTPKPVEAPQKPVQAPETGNVKEPKPVGRGTWAATLPSETKWSYLDSLADSYKGDNPMGKEADKIEKLLPSGRVVESYAPRQYAFMNRSDHTGANIRHSINTPYGKAHPSELFPSLTEKVLDEIDDALSPGDLKAIAKRNSYGDPEFMARRYARSSMKKANEPHIVWENPNAKRHEPKWAYVTVSAKPDYLKILRGTGWKVNDASKLPAEMVRDMAIPPSWDFLAAHPEWTKEAIALARDGGRFRSDGVRARLIAFDKLAGNTKSVQLPNEIPNGSSVARTPASSGQSGTTGLVDGPRGTGSNVASDVAPSKLSAVNSEIEAVKARRDARLKSTTTKGTKQRGSADFTKDDFNDALELAELYVKKAGLTFEQYAKEMVDYFGDGVKPHLKEIWDTHAPVKAVPKVSAPTVEPKTNGEDVTGVAKQVTGRDPMKGASKVEMADRGRQIIEKDINAVANAIDAVEKKGVPMTPDEVSAAGYRLRQIENKQSEIRAAIEKTNDSAELANLNNLQQGLELEVERILKATDYSLNVGFHQYGMAAQIAYKPDFSLAALKSRAKGALLGTVEVVPKHIETKLASYASTIDQLRADLEAARKQIGDLIHKGSYKRGTKESNVKRLRQFFGEDGGAYQPMGSKSSKQRGAIYTLPNEERDAMAAMRSLAKQLADEGAGSLDEIVSGIRKEIGKNIPEETIYRMLSDKYRKYLLESDVQRMDANRYLRDIQRAAEFNLRTPLEKAVEATSDILGATARSFQAGWDISAPFIQGRKGLIANPVGWMKSWESQLKALKTGDAVVNERLAEMERHPLYPRFVAAGGDKLMRRPGGVFHAQEEVFGTNFMRLASDTMSNAGPIGKYNPVNLYLKGLEHSDAAFSAFMNDLTWDTFVKFAKANPSDPAFLRDTVANLGIIYGRGTGPVAEAIGRSKMGNYFYAPRYTLSQMQYAGTPIRVMNPGSYETTAGRMQALRTYGTQAVAYGTLVAIAKLNGWDIETDLRSSDFGTVALPGGRRLDIFGKESQAYRLVANIFAGRVTKKNEYEKPGIVTAWKSVGQFGFGKLAPGPRLPSDVLFGSFDPDKGATPFTMAEFGKRYLPLWVQQTLQNGDMATIPMAILGQDVSKDQKAKLTPEQRMKSHPMELPKIKGKPDPLGRPYDPKAQVNDGDVIKEVQRLGIELKWPDTAEGESEAEYKTRAQKQGDAVRDAIRSQMATSLYKNATITEKREMVKSEISATKRTFNKDFNESEKTRKADERLKQIERELATGRK